MQEAKQLGNSSNLTGEISYLKSCLMQNVFFGGVSAFALLLIPFGIIQLMGLTPLIGFIALVSISLGTASFYLYFVNLRLLLSSTAPIRWNTNGFVGLSLFGRKIHFDWQDLNEVKIVRKMQYYSGAVIFLYYLVFVQGSRSFKLGEHWVDKNLDEVILELRTIPTVWDKMDPSCMDYTSPAGKKSFNSIMDWLSMVLVLVLISFLLIAILAL